MSYIEPADDTANRVYDSIRRDIEYSNADNYQYINPLEVPGPHNKVPLEVPGPRNTVPLEVPGPRNKVPHPDDSDYTAIDPKTLNQHLYMTATPARSLASLRTATPARSLASLHSEAAAIDTVAAGYLQVLPSSSLLGEDPQYQDDGLYENSVRDTSPADLEHQCDDSNLYESV